jgi:ABC-2 type transport system permease protein
MPAADGVIHDIGYQRYTGPRLGRGYAVRSLYGHSLRTAFGLGRSGKAKIFPWTVAGLGLAVAALAVALRGQSGNVVISYLSYCDIVGIPLLLFQAVVAPELLSRDLRARVLPLYFSRPLRRADYALAKLAAMISAGWLILAGPLLLMFIGGVFSQRNALSGAWHEFTDLLGGLLYAAIYAVVYAVISMLVASLAGRRAVAAGAIVAVFLVTTPVVGVLQVIGGPTLRQLSRMVNPVTLVQGIQVYLFHTDTMNIAGFGPVYLLAALILVAGCVTLLITRYRKVAA